jgi:5-methylcytosine-specific restriction protein A
MTSSHDNFSGDTMSQLDELKPTEKRLVIDLVREAGVDISDWANYKGGARRASTNPKYCYEWCFVESTKVVVVNLWYGDLKESEGIVSVEFNAREESRKYSKSAWKIRAKKLDQAVQLAAKYQLPIRVIINEGSTQDSNGPKPGTSRVDYRALDPLPWLVQSYDWKTGKGVLSRGALHGKFVDQFSVPQDFDTPVERQVVTTNQFIRNPAHRTRALQRANGKCEFCGASGFMMANGRIFLETHHVVPLGDGGPDADNNVAAVCPNHHREAHHGKRASEIRQSLLNRLRSAV